LCFLGLLRLTKWCAKLRSMPFTSEPVPVRLTNAHGTYEVVDVRLEAVAFAYASLGTMTASSRMPLRQSWSRASPFQSSNYAVSRWLSPIVWVKTYKWFTMSLSCCFVVTLNKCSHSPTTSQSLHRQIYNSPLPCRAVAGNCGGVKLWVSIHVASCTCDASRGLPNGHLVTSSSCLHGL
jgi:hypothetical protein